MAVVENVRVKKAGVAFRERYGVFLARYGMLCDKSRVESDTLDPLSNDRAAAWPEACAGPPHSSQLVKALWKSVSCPTRSALPGPTGWTRSARCWGALWTTAG
jgi:hypothetical protein